jgi:hypothetical protein
MATKGKRGNAPADAFITDGPSVVVAHPMGPHCATLGLDRPVALLGGGHRIAPDGMPCDLGMDHVAGLRSFVASACRRQASSDRDWYQHPPLALLGMRGVGKGMVAHWIARHAGLPLFRIAVNGLVVAEESAPDRTQRPFPSIPVLAMAASCCANPVIVLEFDVKAPPTPEVEATIVRMIDPRRNARWIDDDLKTIFDLSRISWIIAVHAPAPRRSHRGYYDPALPPPRLPPALASLVEAVGAVIEVEAPCEREDLRRLDLVIEVCTSSGLAIDGTTIGDVHASLRELERSDDKYLPAAELIAHAQQALALLRLDPAG